jgi:hypothetical protein
LAVLPRAVMASENVRRALRCPYQAVEAPMRFSQKFLFGLLITVMFGSGAAAPDVDDFYSLMNEAIERMHAAMHVSPSGDVDRDFVRMMVPHHQGAIDMAVAELRFGKDERLRRLAQAIIVEQGQEITLMHSILGQTPAPPSSSNLKPDDHHMK